MALGIIRNERELIEVYFSTNINDLAAVSELIQCIKDNCDVAEKDKYLQMLDWISSSNIKISQKYAEFSQNDQNTLKKNMGWIIAGTIIIIGILFCGGDVEALPESVGYLSWIGFGIQIYIVTIKTIWKKLTLEGKIVHPMLMGKVITAQNTTKEILSRSFTDSSNHSENSQEKATCKFCGSQLKIGAKFCTNCGKEQKCGV